MTDTEKKEHIIYSLLRDYKLDNPSTLPSTLRNLSDDDWSSFSDKLEKWYDENRIELPHTDNTLKSTPTTFCFPVLPPEYLRNISSHLLIADKVYLDDPLYEIIAILGYIDAPISNIAIRFNKEKLLQYAEEYICFYLAAKELVQENHLVPYKESLSDASRLKEYAEALITAGANDKHVARLWGIKTYPKLIKIESSLAYFTWKLRKNKSPFYENWMPSKRAQETFLGFTLMAPTISSLATFSFYKTLRGLATDFISPDVALMFRKSLEISEKVNRYLPVNKQMLLPGAFSLQTLNLPLLCNVPIERVLDLIIAEPEAYNLFRASLNQKLLSVSAPPSSQEREKEIAQIQEQIKSDIAKMDIVYKSAKEQLRSKQLANLLLGTFSISVAGLSVATQNLNVLGIVGSLAGGAGLTASIKEIAGDWIKYHEEINNIKSNENFFLWQLKTKKKI